MTQKTIELPAAGGPQVRTARRAALDAERYTTRDFMRQEWDAIWSRCWLYAGLVSDVADAGDYFLFNVGRESVVVTRSDDGQLRAFYNVCQHRGNRLLAAGSGVVSRFACPYHGWQYGLDGRLCLVPDVERFTEAPSAADHSLVPVQVTAWAGMVWVNLDASAAPLADFLGDIIQRLSPYRFENWVLAAHQTVTVAANWKTVRDNFLEQYHVDYLHPQHASLVDCCNSTNLLWSGGHSASEVEGYTTDSRYPVPDETPPHLVALLRGLGLDPAAFSGRVTDIRRAVQARKRELAAELGHDYGELSDEQISDVWQFDIFPNTFMTVQAEELWIFGPRPHPGDPDRCYFDKWTLQVPTDRGCDPERGLTLNPRLCHAMDDERVLHDEFDQSDVVAGRKTMTITIDQDLSLLPDMQAGMHSRGFARAVLNRDEVRVQHFHDWVDEYLRRAGYSSAEDASCSDAS